MRIAKFILLLIGILELVLAVGFFFQQTWATALWPVPDTRLSYAFIAAILGGGGAPLIWIGLSDRYSGLTGYGSVSVSCMRGWRFLPSFFICERSNRR